MTPNYIISSQNPAFLAGSSTVDHDQQFHRQFFSPSFHQHQHDASSSSHQSFHFYFNPTQDQDGYNYHTELVNQPQQQFVQGNNGSVAFAGSYDYSHQIENKVAKGLKISHGCNKEGKHEIVGDQEPINDVGKNSSAKLKVKMMHNKMKKSDYNKGGEREDSQKLPFNNNNDHGSSNCSLYNSNITPVRVCSDCNTTKTPLWRSGPKGPKSLCNACGIRQRKARKALAAAVAAAANGPLLSSTETTPSQPPPPPPPPTTTKLKIKVNHQKEKSSNNNNNYSINGLSTVPFKKRCRETTTDNNESSSDQEPPAAPVNGFEDFLINIRNNLGFQNVFPQDEKEAAILLMALSCGLVHDES